MKSECHFGSHDHGVLQETDPRLLRKYRAIAHGRDGKQKDMQVGVHRCKGAPADSDLKYSLFEILRHKL